MLSEESEHFRPFPCAPKICITRRTSSPLENALQIQDNIPTEGEFQQKKFFWIESRFISANPLQRGRFGEEKVYIQQSETARALLTADWMSNLMNNPTYVTGPSGMGKSYALLYLILTKRKNNECSILYINSPAFLFEKPEEYLINEIIYAISGDLRSNLDDISSKVFQIEEARENKLQAIQTKLSMLRKSGINEIIKLIMTIGDYYTDKKAFMLIFDQYCQYEREFRSFPEAYSLVNKVCACFKIIIYGGKFILQSLSSTMCKSEEKLGMKFDKYEAIMFLYNKLKDVIEKQIQNELKENEDEKTVSTRFIQRIEEATEFIPYELQAMTEVILKNTGRSLPEQIDEFYSTRIPIIQEIHRNWMKKLSSPELDRINEVIFALDNSIANGENLLFLNPDPNLTYYNEECNQWCYISNLAKEAIYQYHRADSKYIEYVNGNLSKFINTIVSLMKDKKTPSRTKGGLFKRLIELTIRLVKHKKEAYEIICYYETYKLEAKKKISTPGYLTITLPLENAKIQQFTIDSLESEIIGALTEKEVKVLIPTDPNFVYFDFIIIDAQNPEKRMIYLLQATINIKTHEESDIWFYNDLRKLMNNKATKVELVSRVLDLITDKYNNTEIKFIWIGGDDIGSDLDIAADLLKTKQEDSWIALMNFNPKLSKFLK